MCRVSRTVIACGLVLLAVSPGPACSKQDSKNEPHAASESTPVEAAEAAPAAPAPSPAGEEPEVDLPATPVEPEPSPGASPAPEPDAVPAPEAASKPRREPGSKPSPAPKPRRQPAPGAEPDQPRDRPASSGGPAQGQPCGDGGRCAKGLTCVEYYGIAGPRGPRMGSCEIRCPGGKGCPAGQICTTISDGPGQVCRPN